MIVTAIILRFMVEILFDVPAVEVTIDYAGVAPFAIATGAWKITGKAADWVYDRKNYRPPMPPKESKDRGAW